MILESMVFAILSSKLIALLCVMKVYMFPCLYFSSLPFIIIAYIITIIICIIIIVLLLKGLLLLVCLQFVTLLQLLFLCHYYYKSEF